MFTEIIDPLAGVVDPTAAVDVPCTQAPSEREDQGKDLGRGPPSYAATCTVDTSPTNSVSDARVSPRAHVIAISGYDVATV